MSERMNEFTVSHHVNRRKGLVRGAFGGVGEEPSRGWRAPHSPPPPLSPPSRPLPGIQRRGQRPRTAAAAARGGGPWGRGRGRGGGARAAARQPLPEQLLPGAALGTRLHLLAVAGHPRRARQRRPGHAEPARLQTAGGAPGSRRGGAGPAGRGQRGCRSWEVVLGLRGGWGNERGGARNKRFPDLSGDPGNRGTEPAGLQTAGGHRTPRRTRGHKGVGSMGLLM